jgi:ABC-type phosphate transport system ATPase subunit
MNNRCSSLLLQAAEDFKITGQIVLSEKDMFSNKSDIPRIRQNAAKQGIFLNAG